MARSKYIYLVELKGKQIVMAAFTVKREAQNWAKTSQAGVDEYQLVRMVDGGDCDLLCERVPMSWDETDV